MRKFFQNKSAGRFLLGRRPITAQHHRNIIELDKYFSQFKQSKTYFSIATEICLFTAKMCLQLDMQYHLVLRGRCLFRPDLSAFGLILIGIIKKFGSGSGSTEGSNPDRVKTSNFCSNIYWLKL